MTPVSTAQHRSVAGADHLIGQRVEDREVLRGEVHLQAATFSWSRATCLVPGIGTTSTPSWASREYTQASATCAAVTPLAAATFRTASVKAGSPCRQGQARRLLDLLMDGLRAGPRRPPGE